MPLDMGALCTGHEVAMLVEIGVVDPETPAGSLARLFSGWSIDRWAAPNLTCDLSLGA